MSHVAAITEEVRALERLDLEGLRMEWRRRYGQPPKLRSPDLLARLLAWRIQEEAFGGLDRETVATLRQKRSAALVAAPSAGTRLAREWKGVRHEVEITSAGVRWAGQTYASLSSVARAITGSRWNGHRFFGLRQGSGS